MRSSSAAAEKERRRAKAANARSRASRSITTDYINAIDYVLEFFEPAADRGRGVRIASGLNGNW